MRILEIKAYTFEELSEEAKKIALDRFRYKDYHWAEDNINSLKGFFDAIGCKLIDYSIDWKYPKYCHVEYRGEPIKYNIKEYFTGYCMDYTLSNTWNKTKNIEKCLSAFFKDCNEDYEYCNSDEYLKELIEINEYEFTEHGELI